MKLGGDPAYAIRYAVLRARRGFSSRHEAVLSYHGDRFYQVVFTASLGGFARDRDALTRVLRAWTWK